MKKNTFGKVLGITLTMAMATGMLAGCSNDEKSNNVTSSVETSAKTDKEEQTENTSGDTAETDASVAGVYDPFGNLEITITGVGEDYGIIITNLDETEAVDWVDYIVSCGGKTTWGLYHNRGDNTWWKDSFPYDWELNAGETITITAIYVDYYSSDPENYEVGMPNGEEGFIETFGGSFTRTTYEYTVDDVEIWPTSAADLAEELVATLDSNNRSILQADFDSWEGEDLNSMTLVAYGMGNGALYMVYAVNATNDEAEGFTYYTYFEYTYFHCSSDGTTTTYLYTIPRESEEAVMGDSGRNEGYDVCNRYYTPAGQSYHYYGGYDTLSELYENCYESIDWVEK